jgi:hypothetical protein
MNVRLLAVVMNLFAIVSGSAPALADSEYETTFYSGNACQTMLAADNSSLDRNIYVHNIKNKAVWITCPVAAMNKSNTAGADARMSFFRSGQTTIALTCTLANHNAYGVLNQSISDSSSVTGDGTFTLNLPSSISKSFYHLNCFLPAGSRIYGYVIMENGV